MGTSATPRARLDASYARDFIDGNGAAQTRWHSIGTAFVGDVGISVVLHAVPTALAEGQTRFHLFPARRGEEIGSLPEGLPKRFTVASYRTFPSDDGERTAKCRVGVAFMNEDHIAVLLDAIPSSRSEGTVRLFLRDASEVAASDPREADEPAEEELGDAA